MDRRARSWPAVARRIGCGSRSGRRSRRCDWGPCGARLCGVRRRWPVAGLRHAACRRRRRHVQAALGGRLARSSGPVDRTDAGKKLVVPACRWPCPEGGGSKFLRGPPVRTNGRLGAGLDRDRCSEGCPNVAGTCSDTVAGCSRSSWTTAAGSARRQRSRWTRRCGRYGGRSCSGRQSTRCGTSVPTITATMSSDDGSGKSRGHW